MGDRRIVVDDPSTGSRLAETDGSGPGDLDRVVTDLSSDLAAWTHDEVARRSALRQIAEGIRSEADDLATTLSREQGKPVGNARIEVARAAAWFEHHVDLPIDAAIAISGADARVERRPLGVVGAVTPTNYPILMAAWKLAPALLCGNAVVLKPSPITPLATGLLGRIIDRSTPEPVVSVLVGGADLGQAMVEHPGIRSIAFTGSPEVGWSIARSLPVGKKLVLELGGNDPAVLLDDVDVDEIAPKLFFAGFLNNGQACIAIKRVYAPSSIAPIVADALAELAGRAIVGDGTDPVTTHGPLVTEAGRARVAGLVDDARSKGAKVLTGGRALDRPGWFYEPTVIADATDDMAIVAEEQFGPALPVVGYDSVDEVVATVNAGPYGLGASVWSSDRDRAADVARTIDAGIRWVNTHARQEPNLPFGGRRSSGFGVENGSWGLDAYSDLVVDVLA